MSLLGRLLLLLLLFLLAALALDFLSFAVDCWPSSFCRRANFFICSTRPV